MCTALAMVIVLGSLTVLVNTAALPQKVQDKILKNRLVGDPSGECIWEMKVKETMERGPIHPLPPNTPPLSQKQ